MGFYVEKGLKMKTQQELKSMTRKELLKLHKELFGKGSKEKSMIIINKIMLKYENQAKAVRVEKEDTYVEVIAQKHITQNFGSIRIQVNKGDRFKVPKHIYDYWTAGALSMKLPPPVLRVKAQAMRDIRSRREE